MSPTILPRLNREKRQFPNLVFLIICTAFSFIFQITTGWGQVCQTYTTPGTYTFTVLPGVSSITASVWGAGGGGYSDAGDSRSSAGGGGGGGGGFRTGTFAVTPGQTITIVVGAGGAGADNDGESGNPGGNSSATYGTSITANGGSGGAAAQVAPGDLAVVMAPTVRTRTVAVAAEMPMPGLTAPVLQVERVAPREVAMVEMAAGAVAPGITDPAGTAVATVQTELLYCVGLALPLPLVQW